MKYLINVVFLFSLALVARGQILHPANWEHKFSVASAEVGEEIDLIFDVAIEENWYLYSSDFDPELGPMVTEFHFEQHPSFELIGEIRPIEPKQAYDEIFGGDYTYFRRQGQFRQKIRILSKDLNISGSYSYQVCSDVDGKCIPFDEEFTFEGLSITGDTPTTEPESEIEDNESKDSAVEFTPLDISGDSSAYREDLTDDSSRLNRATRENEGFLTQRGSRAPYSLLGFMLGAFLAGFLALLTPCVYPMIPMTVTFFTNSSGDRSKAIKNALIYGVSIIVIFTLLGTAVSLIFGADFANWLATHWLPNLIFFIMFVFFALWFMGMFEITLPSNLVNQVDKKSESGGLMGIFFMALTLVVVSFSCTGPFVGSILIESATGHVLKPVFGMLGFSLAFAITFTAFAIFPEWLKSLPKSGGWLNSLKVVLGFLELALSLKFLSIVDQVYHWGILDRDVFIAIWIAIFAGLTAYLLGFIKLNSEAETDKSISVMRLLAAIVVLAFTVYITPGMWGAPLKPLAGILPPMTTLDFQPEQAIVSESHDNQICETPKYADIPLHLPHGLKGYFDLQQALDCAKEQNKPVFIDFTGHGCVNCRDMEAVVWSHPEVLRRLRNNFVIVALYVDEKKILEEDTWYVSEYDQKLKKTLGKQNADLQIKWYNNNAQPFYVLLDPRNPQEPLVEPIAYEKNVANFIEFLDAGVAAYRQNQSVN